MNIFTKDIWYSMSKMNRNLKHDKIGVISMEFLLTKEQLLARELFREFAEREVKPLAQKVDEEEYFPQEKVRKMAEIGMMRIPFPKDLGGAGGDYVTYTMVVEELAKYCATTAIILSTHTSLCCYPIYMRGTDRKSI